MRLTRRSALSLAGATALTGRGALATASAQTPTHAATPALFDAWLCMRGGLDAPAYWYSEGLVRGMKDGAIASRMLGVESWITLPRDKTSPNVAVSLSRKIYFFLDPHGDVIVTDAATGKLRRPSIYAYQVRTFTLRDGAIDYAVESHGLDNIRHGGKGATYSFMVLGDQIHVNYITLPSYGTTDPTRPVSAEIYDYFDHGTKIAKVSERYQMNWVGSTTAGQISNMSGWRFAHFDDVPNAWLKQTVRDRFPLWMTPPKDMAEIEALRAQVPFEVKGL